MLRCPACPYPHASASDRAHAPVAFTGPQPARVMLVGEAPGPRELGRSVFCGPTGEELDGTYLRLANLPRESVRVCNAMSCAPPAAKGKAIGTPTPEQARVCAEFHVLDEIRKCQPEIVVLLGAVAVKAMLPTLRIDLETHHGFPFHAAPLLGYDNHRATCFPLYHPAAGLHDTRWMQALQEDFRDILGPYLRGQWVAPVDPYTGKEVYYEAVSAWDVTDYFRAARLRMCDLEPYPYWTGVDTEWDEEEGPYCVTASAAPGTGIFVDAENQKALQALKGCLEARRCGVVFHNVNADLPVCQSLGIDPLKWTDTMQGAYDLGLFRIGLKILAWRELGIVMREYEDVVTPHSKLVLWEYLTGTEGPVEMLKVLTAPPPKPAKQKGVKAEKWVPGEEVQALKKVLGKVKRLVGDMEKDFDGIKPWDRIFGKKKGVHKHADPGSVEETEAFDAVPVKKKQGWTAEEIRVIENPWPHFFTDKGLERRPILRKSIRHVPRKEAIRYAVQDADAARRLRPVIARLMRKQRQERKCI